jgi:transposase InsO family protein
LVVTGRTLLGVEASKETIPVTVDDVTYQRRVRVLELAQELGNVSAACRAVGVSRNSYYKWKQLADRYGLEALRPRSRRRPRQPNETPTWQVEIVLAEAVSRPSLGAGQLLPFLEDRGVELSASGVQKVLNRHQLGRRRQRLSALAQLTAAAGGPVVERALEGPFGFCHFAANPGDLVALDAFYVGKLKGVGKVWQFTAVDTHTRWAVLQLVVGDKTAEAAAAFVDLVLDRLGEHDIEVTGLLTDRGPEFVGREFTQHVAGLGLVHHRTPPRSPNHNAVCERFHGTVLHEFFRVAFHREFFTSVDQLDRQLQTWVVHYNTRRRNRSEYMRGRTPLHVLTTHRDRAAA